MPYISKEEVKEKRNLLKNQFPNLKLSVTTKHYSVIDVSIVAGDIDFKTDYKQVNHFYINDSDYSDKAKQVLQAITDICTKEQSEITYDSDYGSVPNYYFHLSIGKWDKPYELKH